MREESVPTEPEIPVLQPSKPVSGGRSAVAFACWLLSSIGALMSLMMVVGVSVSSLFTQPLSEVLSGSNFYLGFAVAYAWLALAVMTSAWVKNKQLAWHWPVLGGMAGILCSAMFAAFIPLYLPCAFLGLYLCFLHLAGPNLEAQNAA